MAQSFTSLSILVIVFNCTLAYHFPSGVEKCHLSDPKLDDCLVRTITKTFKMISSKGIRSLKLPSIDPLAISEIEIAAGTSAVSLVQHYHNITLHGLCCQEIVKAHFDLDKKVLTFTGQMEEGIQRAKYEFSGKLLVIPVRGHGDSTITLKNSTVDHTITFKEVTRNEKKYFTVANYEIRCSLKGLHVDYQNLFDGDKVLSDNINKVFNENWELVYKDVEHNVDLSYAAAFKVIAAKFFDNIPVNEIFLP